MRVDIDDAGDTQGIEVVRDVGVEHYIPLRRRPRSRSASRDAVRSAMACRLSKLFLPRARAISTLARPSRKYSDKGTIVRPFSVVRRSILSISERFSSILRRRRVSWLVQVPRV